MFYESQHLGSRDYFRLEKGSSFSFPPHLHQSFELIVITSGEMEITVDGHDLLLKKNEAVLIFPHQIHSFASTKSEYMLCIFSPLLVQAYTAKLNGRIPRENRFHPDEYLINALAQISPHSTIIEKKGYLYTMCAQFDQTAVYVQRSSDRKSLLFLIFSFVEAEFTNDCTLTALSSHIGYHPSYLSRYFKKAVGISFNSYVNHYRLSHACYLMEQSDLPILQCALESGYASLRSFNRNFKARFSITPLEYRKNMSP